MFIFSYLTCQEEAVLLLSLKHYTVFNHPGAFCFSDSPKKNKKGFFGGFLGWLTIINTVDHNLCIVFFVFIHTALDVLVLHQEITKQQMYC